ncbi:MAG: biotin--[acetyl-CoA-carboxylase] ligase [Chthoniobacterales bacterium]|nr:biotin--[acetyl-CoA-carboxylase] ligase [Chthoniobacterales bacterium]
MAGDESTIEALKADELRAALAGCIIGREIIVVRETASTNDFVLQMAGPDVAEGVVVFAETQTAGRGQRGKRWESSDRKGLWFSILLRPKVRIEESARLTTWLAGSICTTIAQNLQLPAEVKAPNDVHVNGRKIAGVLVEMRSRGNSYFAIAGIGVNVNQSLPDFPPKLRETAASLAMIAGHPIARGPFAAALLRDFDATYRELLRV